MQQFRSDVSLVDSWTPKSPKQWDGTVMFHMLAMSLTSLTSLLYDLYSDLSQRSPLDMSASQNHFMFWN